MRKCVGVMFLILLLTVNLFSLPAGRAPSSVRKDGMRMTKRFEGFRPYFYRCPSGAKTIGYGFNLDNPLAAQLCPAKVKSSRRPLTKEEADRIFDVLYASACEEVRAWLGGKFDALAVHRKDILTDMAYNLGRARLSRFRKMKQAILNDDYAEAALQMKDSLWYRQTGRRARHHVKHFAMAR